MRQRRLLLGLIGILCVGAGALFVVALLLPGSWAGRQLAGAGIRLEKEPTTFPAEHIEPAREVSQRQGLDGGSMGTMVTFEGLWDGWCRACGTDPSHPEGVEYYAGTLRLRVEDHAWPGYCIDLNRTLETGDVYPADVLASGDPDLCSVFWLLSNYSHERPGPGLLAREEGAAIQAAVWHFVGDFQPAWDPGCWCYKQAVYERATEMIGIARSQCVTLPPMLALEATPARLSLGEVAALEATATGQDGAPVVGQKIVFETTLGELGAEAALTSAQGRAHNEIVSTGAGSAQVTARLAGSFPFAVVLPLDAPKQPVIIQKVAPYEVADVQEVIWEAVPGADLASFHVALEGEVAVVRWETTHEVGVRGFYIYHSPDKASGWRRLNDAPIESQGLAGGSYEWLHRGIELEAANFYLLEIDLGEETIEHGPIVPGE